MLNLQSQAHFKVKYDMISCFISADLACGQPDLPRRVFAPLSGSGLSVCDYIFPDESTADVAERFKEMLGCDLSEGDVDTSMEAQSNVTYIIIVQEVVCLLGGQAPKVP